MTSSAPKANSSKSLPARPRLVLRVGFAGSKALITDEELARLPLPSTADLMDDERGGRARVVAERDRLQQSLPEVLRVLGHRIAALTPGIPVEPGTEPSVAKYFSDHCPLLRLVTGLCEGADAIAGRALEEVRVAPDPGVACEPGTMCLETELAAILPFDVESYRRSRSEYFRAEFDRQLQRCAWVLELDGKYDKPVDDTRLAANRRARAYRAQSAFLLRHSDVLVAAANPDERGRAGGTLETVREALVFGLPVVFIHTGREGDRMYLIGPEDDLYSVLADPPSTTAGLTERLKQWVTQIVADPDDVLNPEGHTHHGARERGEELLREYFFRPEMPWRDAKGVRRQTRRERAWGWVERRFRSGPRGEGDARLDPYAHYRDRATELNYHYSGQYRGAFVMNYGLAVVAVFLAALSLTFLGTASHTPVAEPIATVLESAGYATAEVAVAPAQKPWLLPVLLGMTLLKLGLVGIISVNTRTANRSHWNDRAVNYRYLAERLRTMYYLPVTGSHQPPSAEPPQFASRAVRQSAVDWLFDSLARAISPADMPHAMGHVFPATAEHGELKVRKLLRLNAADAATKIRDAWIGEQAKYHERTTRTMHAMHHVFEVVATFLSWSVLAVVAIDVILVGAKLIPGLPYEWKSAAKAATPWLILVSAVLPAIVAALGGLRFQSECQRLAERSAVMRVLLAGREPGHPVEAAPRWWTRLWNKFAGFWGVVWLVAKRLVGVLAPVSDFRVHGGRSLDADAVMKRIAAHQADPSTDPGSWAHDALRLGERVAMDFVQEAAEWTVLYTKEVSDPG